MSILGPLLIGSVGVAVIYLSQESSEDQRVLVIDENYPLFKDLKDNRLVSFDVQPITIEEGLDKLEGDQYTAVVHVYKDYYKSHGGALYFKKQPSINVQRQIERAIQLKGEIYLLGEFDISETDYRRIKTPFELSAFKYDPASSKSEETNYLPAIVGIVFSVMIYMFIFMYSIQVMRGVLEEKTSRIIEVMISTVKPFQLMMGKIIGVAAVGLFQFIIWSVLSLVIFSAAQYIMYDQYDSSQIIEGASMAKNLQGELANQVPINTTKFSQEDNIFQMLDRVNFPLMIGMFIFYFLGGYLLYSALMAAVGSAVDNDADTQQFILPVTSPLLLSYIASFIIFSNPNSPLAVWMSIIPFTSPVTMIVRISFGIESGDMWQVWLSMFLLIVTFVLVVWLAAKIYRTGILMYGKKPTLREMIKWIKY
jgi:ABC-2 type transport system permease protein